MMREHVVETLQWDVAFASEEEAFDWQGRLASVIRGPALDAIAEVFDELGGAHGVLALDTLTIDLGRLPRAGFEAHLQDRLRAGLRDALRHEMGALQAGTGAGPAGLKQAGTSRVDSLKQFLARGFLPWQAGAGTRRRLDQLAERLALESGPEMARWLRDAPEASSIRWSALLRRRIAMLRPRLDAALSADGPLDGFAGGAWAQLLLWDADWLLGRVVQRGQMAHVRQQMARHFSHAMLLELVGLIVPTERDFIAATIERSDWFGQALDPPVAAHEMQPRLWEFTLAYLLVERGSDFNRRSYIGSLLRRSAGQAGMAYEQLVEALRSSLAAVGAAGGLQRQMLGVLHSLAEEAPQADNPAREAESRRVIAGYDGDGDASLAELGRVKLCFESALRADLPPDSAAREAWTALRAAHPEWLREQIGKHGQAASVRRHMARHFGGSLLMEVAGLLVPGEREFIDAVVSRPAWFAQALDPPVAPQQMQPRLWEFTLAYLLVERGSDFNRRSYLRSLLQHAAREEDMDFGQLLQALIHGLDGDGGAGGLQRQMLQLLHGLRQDAPLRDSEPAQGRSRPGSRRWTQLELPSLRFDWQAAMAANAAPGAAALAAWQTLARHDREWLAGEIAGHAQSDAGRRQLAANFSDATLVEVVEVLARGAGEFVQAVVTHAAVAGTAAGGGAAGGPGAARQRLWGFTLAWLLAERGSEFNRRSYLAAMLRREAMGAGLSERALLTTLVASLQSTAAGGMLRAQMLNLAQGLLDDAAPPGNEVAPDWSRLAGVLQSGSSLAPREAARWSEQAEALLLGNRQGLAMPALERALRSPDAVARLVALLPARLLTRVLFQLRRLEHAAVQQCADRVLAACACASPGVPRGRLEELKWRFIFHELFTLGRPFVRKDFVRRMADWLAAQLRPRAPSRWRQSLAHAAMRDGRGAGQALGREIGGALLAPTAAPALPKAPAVIRKPVAAPAEPEAGEPIYVANAGLVLAEPFLPHLLTLRGLVEGREFKDARAAARGARLMQAVVMGEGEWPEYQLMLNKLMCGLAVADALPEDDPLQAEDYATADGLLNAMLQQWKVLGATTAAGLRETFLRREGRLVNKGDHWQLLVQPGPFDMLVDQVPWGFSTIKYPWMERMIHVQWR
jgi:hypothetical protein